MAVPPFPSSHRDSALSFLSPSSLTLLSFPFFFLNLPKLFLIYFYFLLEYSCCPTYSKVYQLPIYMYPLFFGFPSHLGHHKALSTVPCVIYFMRAPLCPTLCDPMDCSPLAPLSMKFSRQKYWNGLSFPTL